MLCSPENQPSAFLLMPISSSLLKTGLVLDLPWVSFWYLLCAHEGKSWRVRWQLLGLVCGLGSDWAEEGIIQNIALNCMLWEDVMSLLMSNVAILIHSYRVWSCDLLHFTHDCDQEVKHLVPQLYCFLLPENTGPMLAKSIMENADRRLPR